MEWAPFAIRVEPPSPYRDRLGYNIGGVWTPYSPKRGEVKHNAVVNWGSGIPQGHNWDRGGSWHFTVMLDGRLYQHFPASANTWHGGDTDWDGGVRANIDLIGVEHEGVSGLLPSAQLAASVRLTKWLAEQFGYSTFSRYPDQWGWTLVEHNQVSNSVTTCPSNRIPWATFFQALEPAPVPPPVARRRTSMAIIALNNGASGWYFVTPQGSMHLIPDSQVGDELNKLVYGGTTANVSQRTWEWLNSIGMVRGSDGVVK